MIKMKTTMKFVTFALLLAMASCITDGKQEKQESQEFQETQDVQEMQETKMHADTVAFGIGFNRYVGSWQSGESSVSECFLLPVANGNPVLQTVRAELIKHTDYSDDDLQGEMDAFYAGFGSEEEDEEFSTEEEKRIEFFDSPAGFLNYYCFGSFFMEGTAHEDWYTQYSSFDLTTGKIIGEEDLFVDSDEARSDIAVALRKALAEYVGEAYDEEADRELDIVSLMLNNHVYVANEGLYYCYFPNEVSDYMAGEPELLLTKEFLKPYIKLDSPVYKLWFGNEK